ncbi:uncharacterized protein spata7 isoform X2 [Puntigrus tetrazona]|uniref:uncharacterized protein spata7 isoform X2 n=2 Tax=Puntigrus tetrazona TaxID=1606681 RepID=UPI001C8950EA|nr:uncharacterized protein spata7 isoform X2 [Puntigrus tetrazona]
MRFLPEFFVMDAKPGYSLGSSGQLMNQYMIKDHMLSHYRKLYSAKDVDQKRRERFARSQSSARINSRTSCVSKNSRPSVQGDAGPCPSPDPSSPGISTSFRSRQTVYPSPSASELTRRSPNPRWRGYASFQDPARKTYGGDVLLKTLTASPGRNPSPRERSSRTASPRSYDTAITRLLGGRLRRRRSPGRRRTAGARGPNEGFLHSLSHPSPFLWITSGRMKKRIHLDVTARRAGSGTVIFFSRPPGFPQKA